MKEKLQEIYSGLQERLKSPFILTFLIVWSIHHWRLVFIICSFDKDLSQGLKKSIIEEYIEQHDRWKGMFWSPVWYSLLSLLLYYFISLGYEGLHIIYSKYGRPFVNKLDQNKLALKEDVKKEKKRITKLREEIIILEESVASLNDAIKEKDENFSAEATKRIVLDEKLRLLELELKTFEDYSTLKASKDTLEKSNKELSAALESSTAKLADDLANKIHLENWLKANHNDILESYISIGFSKKLKDIAKNGASIYDFFIGNWQITYTSETQRKIFKEFHLEKNNIMVESKTVYRITNFEFNAKSKIIVFTRYKNESYSEPERFQIEVLTENYMKGAYLPRDSNMTVELERTN
jgi:hypothetical protein